MQEKESCKRNETIVATNDNILVLISLACLNKMCDRQNKIIKMKQNKTKQRKNKIAATKCTQENA
jgi:hypothetical protein